MGAHKDAIQGAVVLGVAVISALLDSAFNTLVGMAIHKHFLLLVWCKDSMTRFVFSIHPVAFPEEM